MFNPAISCRDLLVKANVGVFNSNDSTEWSIRVASQPDEPDQCITIYLSGGQNPNPRWKLNFPSIQVRIRGKDAGYVEAYEKAQEVVGALLGIPSQDLNGDRLVLVNQIGDIVPVGYDDDRRPHFTTNFAMIIEPTDDDHRDPL